MVAGAWWAVVLANADLRFALVDLNLASRAGAVTAPVDQLAAALRAMIVPLVGTIGIARAGAAGGGPRPAATEALGLGVPVIIVIVLSRHGFDHYWI